MLRRLGQPYFADVENLNLLDAPTFLSLFPPERDNRLITSGLPLLPVEPRLRVVGRSGRR